MTKEQALQSFWESFNIPAYQEASVPDDAKLPRITYQNASGFLGDQLALSASVWYRETTWKGVEEKVAEIGNAIGRGGKLIHYDGGMLWINRGSPFSFSSPADPADDAIRRKIINITVEFL